MTDPTVPGERAMARKPLLRWLVLMAFAAAIIAIAVWAAIWGSHWASHGYNGTHSHGNPSDSPSRL